MNNLASEILERIFTELDGLHVVALRQVCLPLDDHLLSLAPQSA